MSIRKQGSTPDKQETISKMHPTSNGCVAIRFKMLTYYRVRSAFKPNRRLAIERNLLSLR
jgi:hypothetical protein